MGTTLKRRLQRLEASLRPPGLIDWDQVRHQRWALLEDAAALDAIRNAIMVNHHESAARLPFSFDPKRRNDLSFAARTGDVGGIGDE